MKRDQIRKVEKALVDEGKIIEAGWQGLRLMAVPLDAPAVQVEEMRNAFFAGAHHLLSTVLSVLDDDAEPTIEDLHRMDQIHAELQTFMMDYAARHGIEGDGL